MEPLEFEAEILNSTAETTTTNNNTGTVKRKNYQRKRTDYIWLFNILIFYICVGELFWPERSSIKDRAYIFSSCNLLGFKSAYAVWGFWFLTTVSSLFGFTCGLW